MTSAPLFLVKSSTDSGEKKRAVPPVGSWQAFALLHWVDGLIPWRSGDQVIGHVVGQRFSTVLGGSYSLGFAEVAADLPVVLDQGANLAPLTGAGIRPPRAARRAEAASSGRRLAILADLPGPKMRIVRVE